MCRILIGQILLAQYSGSLMWHRIVGVRLGFVRMLRCGTQPSSHPRQSHSFSSLLFIWHCSLRTNFKASFKSRVSNHLIQFIIPSRRLRIVACYLFNKHLSSTIYSNRQRFDFSVIGVALYKPNRLSLNWFGSFQTWINPILNQFRLTGLDELVKP